MQMSCVFIAMIQITLNNFFHFILEPEEKNYKAGLKFCLKENIEAVSTNNIDAPYKVHHSQCSGHLNDDEIKKMKIKRNSPQCCKFCLIGWKNIERLRADSRNKKSNLQLIQSKESLEYLDREKRITPQDIAQLSRSAVDILVYNLVSKHQTSNSLIWLVKSDINENKNDDDDDSDSDSNYESEDDNIIEDIKEEILVVVP